MGPKLPQIQLYVLFMLYSFILCNLNVIYVLTLFILMVKMFILKINIFEKKHKELLIINFLFYNDEYFTILKLLFIILSRGKVLRVNFHLF